MDKAATRVEFVGWIADHFQERHTPPLDREKALAMADETMAYQEEDAPFGHPDYSWDRGGAKEIAQDEIDSTWEFE